MVVQVYRKKDVSIVLPMIPTNGNGTTNGNEKMTRIDPGLFYHEMSDKEVDVWKQFLPTAYWPGSKIGRTIANYRFDIIPDEVKEEMRFAEMSGLFDGLEIWTPEGRKKHDDPLAIGALYKNGQPDEDGMRWRVHGNRTQIQSSEDIYCAPYRAFILARWGESLVSYSQIRFEVLCPEKSNYCGWCTARIRDIEKGCGCKEAREELRRTGKTQHWRLCV